MRRYSVEERRERGAFVTVLTRNIPEAKRLNPEAMTEAIERIVALSNRHGKFAEKECNEGLSPAEERRVERIEGEIRDLLEKLGLPRRSARFGGDPRGYTVKLMLPDESYNTFGGRESGYGVPQL